ncbi:MAG TPA: CAP domain-containing protein [Bauldia sp.]|nr:CAP domain-containing protein [Bauldia sp.]
MARPLLNAPAGATTRRRVIGLLLGGAALSGCSSLFGPKIDIIEGAAVANAPPATVDPGTAAAKISAYRKSKGLSAVTVSGTLNGIAGAQARAMASAGKMGHSVGGAFPARMSRGGYDAAIAAENLAAGPQNLDQAFESWKKSPGHNANLLKPGVTEIGIAVAYTPNGRFRDYWALVLAAPDDRKTARSGPDAGPLVPVAR